MTFWQQIKFMITDGWKSRNESRHKDAEAGAAAVDGLQSPKVRGYAGGVSAPGTKRWHEHALESNENYRKSFED